MSQMFSMFPEMLWSKYIRSVGAALIVYRRRTYYLHLALYISHHRQYCIFLWLKTFTDQHLSWVHHKLSPCCTHKASNGYNACLQICLISVYFGPCLLLQNKFMDALHPHPVGWPGKWIQILVDTVHTILLPTLHSLKSHSLVSLKFHRS